MRVVVALLLLLVAAFVAKANPPTSNSVDCDTSEVKDRPLAASPSAGGRKRVVPTEYSDLHKGLKGNSKIINGQVVHLGEYPWAASVGFYLTTGEFYDYCAGSLVAPEWVVTASHCKVKVGHIVRVGLIDLASKDDQPYRVEFVCRHPNFGLTDAGQVAKNNNDITLLRLDRPSSEAHIGLIDRAIDGTPPDPKLWVAGWGNTEDIGEASRKSNVLLDAQIDRFELGCEATLHSDKTLKLSDKAKIKITDLMLCAGGATADSCQGDSGGPLMYKFPVTGKFALVGIVSYGIGCGKTGMPAVYTRVSVYDDWIKKITGLDKVT
jgi:secreted trypsin-like serine protease